MLPLEQQGFRLSHQAIRCVVQLLTLLHQVLRRFPDRLGPESYFRG